MLVPSSDYNRKGTRASALRFDLMARILLHDEHEHESWHLTAVLPTCTVLPCTDKTSRRYACETNPDNLLVPICLRPEHD